MNQDKSHVKSVSKVPGIATTAGAVKYQALGDFITHLELMRRQAPWGVVYNKGYIGSGGTTGSGGGGTGGLT